MYLRMLSTSLFLAFATSMALAGEKPVVTSEKSACTVLMRGAVTYRLSVRDLSGRYYCTGFDSERYPKGFYVLALRYHVTPDELVGSNLIGFFAVRKADGALFEFDTNEDELKKLREPSEWKK